MSLYHTSERVVEDYAGESLEDYFIYQYHIATYKYVTNNVANKKVLDFGCGSGYGTALISQHCKEIIGIDISNEAVEYAKSKYSSSNLSFLSIDSVETCPLPFNDNEFEVILSFQVIEHIDNTTAFLKEINRVLKPGGEAIIVTPDRSTRLFSFQKPWNIWHVKEFSKDSLSKELGSIFNETNILKMGAPYSILSSELKRTKMMKWISLPFTLPFISDNIRKKALMTLKKIKNKRNKIKGKDKILRTFDDSIFEISEEVDRSINLVALCRKLRDNHIL